METSLQKIKSEAKSLLYLDIVETTFSPIIVSHPFTDSAFISIKDPETKKFTIINILESKEALKAWQQKMSKLIDSMDSVHSIMMLVNKPYRFAFLKFSLPYLSNGDMSELLGTIWSTIENSNMDANMSKAQVLKLFKKADKKRLMDEDELKAYENFPEVITVYRGITDYNKKNVRALSWSTDRDVAKWFACRFSGEGYLYQAQIKKEDVFAFFSGKNESEIILDPSKLIDIEQIDF